MLELSSWFIIGIIYNYFYCYIYSRFNNKEKFRLDGKKISIIIFVSLINSLALFYPSMIVKILFKYVWIILMSKIIYKDSFSKCLITSFLIYVVLSISEMLFSIIFISILRTKIEFYKTSFTGIILSNFIIMIITFLLLLLSSINKLMYKIITLYSEKKYINTIFIILLAIITIYFFIYQSYMGYIFRDNFIIVLLFFLGVVVFILGYLVERTNNAKLAMEYDQLLDYVKTYEEVIEEKSKNQHEYNNQLILIREMLGNRNKKVKEYIDQILSIKNEQSKGNWLNKIKNIPNGGLKGLIHYKIVEMEKKKIKLYIDINENVNNKKTNKYLRDNLNDISKIIGVYLDNAREAALKSKEKYIIIEAECNKDKLNFSISNTYKGGINLSKIDNAGYSKKGKSRGYGLSLVHDIINRRNDVEQYREFNGIYFVQHVCLKYKK